MVLKDLLHTTLLWVVLIIPNPQMPIIASAQSRNEILSDPIIYYSTTELACADGYPVQEHKVVTADGYILTIHRIPAGRMRPKIPHSKNHFHKIHLNHHPDFDNCIKESINMTSTGQPVLFVHGLLMASDCWLLQGPGYDLVYLMADNGFDVWMANIRGNFYSKEHRWMSSSNPKFWDFSFHENAVYDLPAIIDYILKATKREKLGYIGYSMGTTIFFTMASARPEYNNKILGFVGLAPVAFIKEANMNGQRRAVFDILLGVVDDLRKRGYVHEVFPRSSRLVSIGMNYCSKGSHLQDFCYDLISVILGYHSRLVLRNKFHLYLTHLPTGTSLKTFHHYKQNVVGNTFKPFDYGKEKNMEIYGMAVPPDYPLWNITAPVALYYTGGDFFYDVKDVEQLIDNLPNVIDVDVIQKFNHGDYLWSYKAKDLVYQRVVSVLKKLSDQYNHQTRKSANSSSDS